MAETILGIDFGYESLKLALVSGGQVKKTLIVPMPINLIKEGRVVSTETMGELIRTEVRKNGMSCRYAAVAFPNETVFVRNVMMPVMTHDQLLYNLPYEFRDYITDELKNYIYDYAVIKGPEKEQAAPAPEEKPEENPEGGEEEANSDNDGQKLQLLAAAVPSSIMDDTRALLRKAGFKLACAAPVVSSYINLIRGLDKKKRPESGEYCILDLGYKEVRMYMFKNDVNIATRVLEVGMSVMDDVLAEAYNVDVHLAHTYLLTNYDGCQTKDACLNAFSNIAVELMRAVNFYNFSNPDSHLTDIWLCGGGSVIPSLAESIQNTLSMNIHQASELVPGGDRIENCNSLVQAIGIAMNSGR